MMAFVMPAHSRLTPVVLPCRSGPSPFSLLSRRPYEMLTIQKLTTFFSPTTFTQLITQSQSRSHNHPTVGIQTN